MRKYYYSGTWSWVKPLTIPESPPIDLYNTCPVDGLSQLHAICGALLMFNWTEVVRLYAVAVLGFLASGYYRLL